VQVVGERVLLASGKCDRELTTTTCLGDDLQQHFLMQQMTRQIAAAPAQMMMMYTTPSAAAELLVLQEYWAPLPELAVGHVMSKDEHCDLTLLHAVCTWEKKKQRLE
jgi:hypothetical protein